jgi:hypothetical protein
MRCTNCGSDPKDIDDNARLTAELGAAQGAASAAEARADELAAKLHAARGEFARDKARLERYAADALLRQRTATDLLHQAWNKLGEIEAEAPDTEPLILRPVVVWFARAMERKLRENDHKPGWRGEDAGALLERVDDEIDELKRAVGVRPPLVVLDEAADVANMAMMVADVCSKQERPDGWDRPVVPAERP